jgi:hypothetical protein
MATNRSSSSGDMPRRLVKVWLSSGDWQELGRSAEVAGIEPDQLAAVWLADVIDRAASRRAIRGEVPTSLTRAANGTSDAVRPTVRGSQRRRPTLQPQQPVTLHEEILAVLNERQTPMTVAQIAEAIRRRDLYQPPRSGRPVSPQLISSRLSNPYYRSLFQRTGRLVGAPAQIRPESSPRA